MAAAAPIVAAAIGAGVTIHQSNMAREQNEKAMELSKRQAEMQNRSLESIYAREANAQEAQAEAFKAQSEEEKKKLSQDAKRQQDLQRKLANPGAGGRESTILTGPQGLNYESSQKTLIGG